MTWKLRLTLAFTSLSLLILCSHARSLSGEALPTGRIHKRPADKSLIYLPCYGWKTSAEEPFSEP